MTARVGFIGLGDMGVPMAGRLADAGLNPLLWARRPESADPVVARGGELAPTVDALFDVCDRVVLMLANGAAMDEVLGRGGPDFARRVEGVTLIHMGTTPPGYSEGLAADVIAAGGQYAEMPVSGSTGPAATGDLIAMSAGTTEAIAAAEDIVSYMCRATLPCGAVPKALQMKLAVNTYLIGLVMGLTEAVNLARRSELDLGTLAKVLESGPMSCDLMRMKLPKLIDEEFSPQGSIRQFRNNSQMVVDEGKRVGAPTPWCDVSLELTIEAISSGLQDEDMVAVARVLAARGG